MISRGNRDALAWLALSAKVPDDLAVNGTGVGRPLWNARPEYPHLLDQVRQRPSCGHIEVV